MGDIKQFVFAAEKAAEDQIDGTHFEINGQKVVAYEPQDGQYALLMASIGRGTSEMDKIAAIINFFIAIMNEDGALYIERRLLDRKDPFGIQQVEEILEWLTEEWSAHPTQPPSGSTQSPQSTGPSSTQPMLLST